MPSHNAAAMILSVAAVMLCCAVHVSAFANLPAARFGASPLRQSGWRFLEIADSSTSPCRRRPRLSMKLDEDTSGFDPLGLTGGERRRRGGKGALKAIKIGMGARHSKQEEEALITEAPPSTEAVVQGWDYWKYRALLLGVALLWGTNFPAVCSPLQRTLGVLCERIIENLIDRLVEPDFSAGVSGLSCSYPTETTSVFVFRVSYDMSSCVG